MKTLSISPLRLFAFAMIAAAPIMVASGPVQAAPAKAKPISFVISNQGCFKGAGIAPYVNQAIAQRKRAAQRDGGELASFYVRVPARPWHGLTVTGVGLHYESTSVYFREPEAKVRRVLKGLGVRIEPNGNIPMLDEEAVESQLLSSTDGESRTYGASAVTCGV